MQRRLLHHVRAARRVQLRRLLSSPKQASEGRRVQSACRLAGSDAPSTFRKRGAAHRENPRLRVRMRPRLGWPRRRWRFRNEHAELHHSSYLAGGELGRGGRRRGPLQLAGMRGALPGGKRRVPRRVQRPWLHRVLRRCRQLQRRLRRLGLRGPVRERVELRRGVRRPGLRGALRRGFELQRRLRARVVRRPLQRVALRPHLRAAGDRRQPLLRRLGGVPSHRPEQSLRLLRGRRSGLLRSRERREPVRRRSVRAHRV